MQYIVMIGIVFAALLAAPFCSALLCCKKEGSVLHIEQSRTKDPRYFGKSFARMMEKSLAVMKDGNLFLSRKERFIEADVEEISKEAEEVVICLKKEFHSSEGTRIFRKEIYGVRNVEIADGGVTVRAVYSGQKLRLGRKTTVARWADAEETVAAYDDCNLGISTSAGRRLSIGKNCTFHRLYAPEILIGQYPEEHGEAMRISDTRILEPVGRLEVKHHLKYVDKQMLNGEDVADFTVLSDTNVVLLEGIILRGDLCSHKGVRICNHAVVCGNVFAEKEIIIGEDAMVLGNVFSQGSIVFEKNAVVGQRGKIVSVIARENIIFQSCAYVFGYISCENGGIVKAASMSTEEHEHRFLDCREEKNLQKVTLPGTTKKVSHSMFFGCTSLTEVSLPRSIEVIDSYAFADCRALVKLTSLARLEVKEIRTSAFENCVGLEHLEFAEELEVLGGAAFAGCSGLKSVVFAEGSRLKVISAHCFRGCLGLVWVELPDSVETVGVSAFAGCDSLQCISVPASCAKEPGVTELRTLGKRVEIRGV